MQARSLLLNCGKECQPITYTEFLHDMVKSGFNAFSGADDPRLHDLLGWIGLEEVQIHKGPNISALVITKENNLPGHGFFTLQRFLNRYCTDDMTTFVKELNDICQYSKNSHNP